MNVFTRVTWRTLMKNRVRTLVTIVGILLSTAMFTAVTTMVVSFQDYLYRSTMAVTGNWHGAVYNLPADQQALLAADGLVETVFACQDLGYAARDVEAEDSKPYLYVQAADAQWLETMPVTLIAGRLPETPAELVVNGNLSGSPYHIGDTLTLALGDRVWQGETMQQWNPVCYDDENGPGETLAVRETRTYTVVGLMDQPYTEDYSAPGSVALTVWDDGAPAERVDVYYRLTDPSAAFAFQLGEPIDGVQHWSFADGATSSSLNTELLMTMGFSRYSTYRQYLLSLGAILAGLIVFGSVALIYNAFSISVAERTRQFGLFSSVGATRPQLRRMVMTEALLVSAAGIPLGLLAGLTGLGVTLHFLGDRFYVLTGVEDVGLRMIVSWQALAVAAALALATVLLSAWVPARRAMAVPAMEAIRQTGDVTVPRRRRKGTWSRRLFGLPGLLAQRYYTRSRRRYRATVVSLCMSVVLFVSASGFTAYMTRSVRGTLLENDYDLSYSFGLLADDVYGRPLTAERVLSVFRSADHVTAATAVYAADALEAEIPRSDLPAEVLARLTPDASAGPGSSAVLPSEDGRTMHVPAAVMAVDDGTYRSYLASQGLDAEPFLDAEHPQAVVLAMERIFDGGRTASQQLLRSDAENVTVTWSDPAASRAYFESLGTDEITEEQWEAGRAQYERSADFPVGAVVTELPMGLNRSEYRGVYILLPWEFVAETVPAEYVYQSVYAVSDDPAAAGKSVAAGLLDAGIRVDRLYNAWEDQQTDRNMVLIVRVLSYGFIALISLIAVANVFNTVSTNLLLRRRELAMLRSAGMAARDFRRMLLCESLLYGTRSLLWGLPLATLVTYAIYRSTGLVYEMDFFLPWGAVTAAAAGVFAVVLASMAYGWRRIRRDNPVETLRREAI